MSLVAATPRCWSSPASSPASRPTLSGFETQTPTSSMSGRLVTPMIAFLPTFPVLHTTTRYVSDMVRTGALSQASSLLCSQLCSVVPDAHVKVCALQAAVDLDELASDVAARGRREEQHGR